MVSEFELQTDHLSHIQNNLLQLLFQYIFLPLRLLVNNCHTETETAQCRLTVFVDRRIVIVAGGDERPAGGAVEVGASMVLKKQSAC